MRRARGLLHATERPAGAIAAGLLAFLLYYGTLLPGMDLGDSASFQADAGSRLLTPRQAYPLYFAIAGLSVHLSGGEPARAVNMASAVCGALAVAILALVVSGLTESTAAGIFAALLFASSYTFWSQSVTAEVYALHMLAVALTLLALQHWAARPSRARLAIVFAVYALSFGNHLSMILLAPAIVLYIALAHPAGWRGLMDPRTVILAIAIAVAGAAQYAWNIAGMLAMSGAPEGLDAARAFWFDVTKSDWRESMVLATGNRVADRLAMYWFDLRQQFGLAGIAFAISGTVALAVKRPRESALLNAAYVANWIFAFTYNVGDVHVFFLPSHLVTAAAAGYGVRVAIGAIGSERLAAAAAAASLAYPAWRAYDTFPALDRTGDRRGQEILAELTAGLPPDRAILAADLNWQLQNGLSYYGRHHRPDLQWFRVADRWLAFPTLVEDNGAIGRRVFLTADARRRVTTWYGSAYEIEQDSAVAAPSLEGVVQALPDGTPYVFCVLAPYRERPLDAAQTRRVVSALTGSETEVASDGYTVAAGVKGAAPQLIRYDRRPFKTRVRLPSLDIVVRMDSWLASDTIRRAGFGHVIANRRHALAIDRGLSLVAWPGAGDPVVAYDHSLFTRQRRYVLRGPAPD